MTAHRVPHSLLVYATTTSHLAMAGGAVVLYTTGKIDSTVFAAIMATFGAGWSGVAGTLIAAKRSQAVTPSAGATTAPSVLAAPVTHTSATPVESP